MKIALIVFIATLLSCANKRNEIGPENKVSDTTIQVEVKDSLLQTNHPYSYGELISMIETNPYTTVILKGGYSVSYSHDSEMQFLLLSKGSKIIDTVSTNSLGLPYKNLGFVAEDFDNTFIFLQSFGGGNSIWTYVIDKKTGTNLIPETSAFMDIDTSSQLLLYSENDIPKENDQMTLVDLKTMKKSRFPFPSEVFGDPEVCNRIKFLTTSKNSFAIE